MAWPWPWWKKLTLLLHHFYKPDFLQFSSTRFGCQADTSWDISLWNISVASTLGREEEEHNWKLWIFVQIDTKTNRRQCDGIIYSFSPPWRPLGPAWGLSRGGELLWRADLTRGGADCFKSTLPNVIPESSQDRSGQKRQWDNWDMLLDFWDNWETTVTSLWLQILEF